MSKFKNTIKSNHYWLMKGQGEIYKMLNENINERGDGAKLAEKIGVTPGYISQIINGESEINPTWKKIVSLCLSLGKVPLLEIKDVDQYMEEQRTEAISVLLRKNSENINNFLFNTDFPSLQNNIDIYINYEVKTKELSEDSFETMTYFPEDEIYELL